MQLDSPSKKNKQPRVFISANKNYKQTEGKTVDTFLLDVKSSILRDNVLCKYLFI